jgi:hypothetical protein
MVVFIPCIDVITAFGITWDYRKVSDDLTTCVKEHDARATSVFINFEDFVEAVLTRNTGSCASI